MTTDQQLSGSPAEAGQQEAIRLGKLADTITFQLRRAHGAAFRTFKRDAGISALRPGWYAVLSLISDNPGITPVVLSRGSGRDKSTITPILRDLGRNQLIRQTPVPGDRRSYSLDLTEAGREALLHLAAAADSHDRALSRILGTDRPLLMQALCRMIAELERTD
ncbi:MAG: MarR family transcriptional regulator [Amaricoccus sp.]